LGDLLRKFEGVEMERPFSRRAFLAALSATTLPTI
jgi:hypothetical protein